ncbi:hypothetical protein LCGC14_0380720 [marine sediment metagenome]|uniref:Uncharacterized protein n=1 Tax=marine sediment metagenome TaxID=412755 RepID=A0A0F9VPR2_9ZZZZ
MSYNPLDPDLLEEEYRKLIREKIITNNPDCVDYLDAMWDIKKIEQKCINAGMMVIISLDIVEIRKGKPFLAANKNVKKRFGR